MSAPGTTLFFWTGPFAEAKEVTAGHAILNADSKQAAIELAKDFLRVAGPGRSEIFTIMGGPPETQGQGQM